MNRQYIGARYVPKFADPIEWDNLRSYEALTIVTYAGTSYTSKKPVPVGVELNNTEYWVVTGNYNAQVELYRQDVTKLKKSFNQVILNVLDYNVINDGVTDNYDALFELMHSINESVILFFPKGKYIISDTIFIPSNITLEGCGDESEIYFNGLHGYYGAGLMTAGDNICIKNLKINHLQTTDKIIQASMLGGIGISSMNFSGWTTKHQQIDIDNRPTKNIALYNLSSDNNYLVNCETNTSTISNILYENLYCPKSKVSFGGNGTINNVTMKNIVCSLCGAIGGGNNDIAFYNNINTSNLHLGSGISFVTDCVIDTKTNYNLTKGMYDESVFLGGNYTNLSNVRFCGNNPDYSHYMLIGSNDVFMTNVSCEHDTYSVCIKDANPTNGKLYCSNCDFGNTTIATNHGFAVNSTGIFSEETTFVNKTKNASIIHKTWNKKSPVYNETITEPVKLSQGCYLLEINMPTCTSSESGFIGIKNEENWEMKVSTNNKACHLLNVTTENWYSLYSMSSGLTFDNIEKGYLNIVKL